jgi:CDP-diacylglycerol--glycerol-3-phosphate 3-phosphatidyltransferase
LRRTGLSPDHLTALGIALAFPSAFCIATGHLIAGMLILIGSALPDLFDGSLAKASGRTSRRGAFFDSVGDRVSDTVVLVGVAWYMQDRFGHHAAVLPLAVLGASQVVSYIRAKADVLGINAKGGIMERGERIFVLCAALTWSFVMVWLLWLIFALSCVTAVQRFVTVWRQAGKPPAPLPVEPTAVVLRWRAWREERAGRDAWWARAPRGPASSPGGGFLAGSRRPGGGAANSRWLERRERAKEHRAAGAAGAGTAEEHRAGRHEGARQRPGAGNGQD